MSMVTGGSTREQASAKARPSLLRRLTKTLLLVIVPVIAAAVIVGVSLQVIGVPVLQTTLGYVEGQLGHRTPSASDNAIAQMQSDNQNLRLQVTSLTAKSNQQAAEIAQLQSQLSQTQNLVQAKKGALATAQSEAQIVTQMDPAAAAQVVGKLPDSEAGLVVASLSPSAASAVLAAMDPSAAAKLLELAGQSDNSTGNSTGP
jgi:flagellar motility protein MotE (MotC chaperone)